jgi:stage IV sporulation protein FB
MPTEPWRESLRDPDERGGWRSVARRVFGGSENPLRWGFPLYTAWGILVRVHLFFPVFIAAELIRAVVPNGPGLLFVAPLMLAFFVLVLLHEYGHCLACRRVGGEADEILMWPLGGLASCTPPHRWDASLWTTVGGPAVNAVLLVPLGLAVWLLTGETRAAVFNPFAPGAVWILLDSPGSTALHLLKITLWSFHYANALLLAFNVLIPMYPMDGGRIVHALLWRRLGHRDATRIAAIVGLVAAGVMAVFAIVFSELVLLALALFGGIICYTELQRLKFEQSADDAVFAASLAADDETDTPPESKRAEKQRAKAQDEQAEIDRILEKISTSGMDSLSRKERKTLERASAKSRHEG